MKTTSTFTQESFNKLLTWLDPNREAAARKYESIHARLRKYFECNGCGDDDDFLADVTIDRVGKKLDRGDIPEPFTGDKSLYFLAFAKRIRLEHITDRKPLDIPVEIMVPDAAEDADICLEQCISTLAREDRGLAIEYYSCEKTTKVRHHQKLAKQYGLSLAGLRTRIHRVRERLRPCIEECLERRQG
jgi:hypothetical protein